MSDLQCFHQTPFHRWAETQQHLSCQSLLGMLIPVIHPLRALHQEGLGHGAISPDSLIINLATQQLDIGHFSACRSEYIARGTPYSPPEADAEPPAAPSVQSDIYSLAAVFYHALNGHPPTTAAVRQAREGQLPFSSTMVTEAERSALLQALALDASQRPASIAELENLLRLQPTLPMDVAQPTPPPPASQPPEKSAVLDLAIPKTVERLPMNLTKGKPCKIPVNCLFSAMDPEWDVTYCNLEELGLELDELQSHLIGQPNVDGEHLIRVQLIHRAPPLERPKLERSIKVTINPDPAAIWKNLDSNRDDPYWKPDTDHFALTTPAALAVAASVRGRSHAQEGLFRDDDFRVENDDKTGWHLLAVADGAGSAKLSRRGSQVACEQALIYLKDQLCAEASKQDRPNIASQAANDNPTEEQARSLAYAWLGGAAHAALKSINEEAAAQQDPARQPKDYATTLLLAAARKTPAGWVILCFGIGDGGIGLLLRDGTVKVLSSPDSGEFSSETIFLTSKNLWMTSEGISQRLHVAMLPDYSALVLMTDGITDPLFPTEVSLGDKDVWNSFWTDIGKHTQLTPSNSQASAELLQWAGFYSRGNHDDRTIALVLPHPPTPVET